MNCADFENKDYKDLYFKLKEVYNEENLNLITSKIVCLYQSKQYSQIRKIVNAVFDHKESSNEKISKAFSKLVMLYHPDKLNYYLKTIDDIHQSGDLEKLCQYSHIFVVMDLEDVEASGKAMAYDCEFQAEYKWDFNEKGYYCFSEDEVDSCTWDFNDYYGQRVDYGDNIGYSDDDCADNSFYSAVKRKIYGNRDIELPSCLLEDLEDIEMAEYEIDSLEGIECCRYVIHLDLSNNNISNISELENLRRLEELYLTNNQIGFIDAVINLKNLRIVDLSHNEIDDLSPLFNLPKLEYVNAVGNKVPEFQVKILKSKGVFVSC